MFNLRIGIFGCGNMGTALVLAMSSRFPQINFYLYNPTQIKASNLALIVSGHFVETLSDMPQDLDWYFLAFKPQSLDSFNFQFKKESKLISILAGVSIDKLQKKFQVDKMARLMPNTPTLIGEGASLLYLSDAFSFPEFDELNILLSSTGSLFSMDSENDLNIATAFSGSGPALIFEIARIFEEELINLTEGRVPAHEIILKTFLGSSKLMNEKNEISFSELRNQVTSKKGVTYEALSVLEESKLQSVFTKAFEAANKRTKELSM